MEISQLLGPLEIAVEYSQNLNPVRMYSIWDEIWESEHDQFTSSGDTASPARLGRKRETADALPDSYGNSGCCGYLVTRDE